MPLQRRPQDIIKENIESKSLYQDLNNKLKAKLKSPKLMEAFAFFKDSEEIYGIAQLEFLKKLQLLLESHDKLLKFHQEQGSILEIEDIPEGGKFTAHSLNRHLLSKQDYHDYIESLYSFQKTSTEIEKGDQILNAIIERLKTSIPASDGNSNLKAEDIITYYLNIEARFKDPSKHEDFLHSLDKVMSKVGPHEMAILERFGQYAHPRFAAIISKIYFDHIHSIHPKDRDFKKLQYNFLLERHEGQSTASSISDQKLELNSYSPIVNRMKNLRQTLLHTCATLRSSKEASEEELKQVIDQAVFNIVSILTLDGDNQSQEELNQKFTEYVDLAHLLISSSYFLAHRDSFKDDESKGPIVEAIIHRLSIDVTQEYKKLTGKSIDYSDKAKKNPEKDNLNQKLTALCTVGPRWLTESMNHSERAAYRKKWINGALPLLNSTETVFYRKFNLTLLVEILKHKFFLKKFKNGTKSPNNILTIGRQDNRLIERIFNDCPNIEDAFLLYHHTMHAISLLKLENEMAVDNKITRIFAKTVDRLLDQDPVQVAAFFAEKNPFGHLNENPTELRDGEVLPGEITIKDFLEKTKKKKAFIEGMVDILKNPSHKTFNSATYILVQMLSTPMHSQLTNKLLVEKLFNLENLDKLDTKMAFISIISMLRNKEEADFIKAIMSQDGFTEKHLDELSSAINEEFVREIRSKLREKEAELKEKEQSPLYKIVSSKLQNILQSPELFKEFEELFQNPENKTKVPKEELLQELQQLIALFEKAYETHEIHGENGVLNQYALNEEDFRDYLNNFFNFTYKALKHIADDADINFIVRRLIQKFDISDQQEGNQFFDLTQIYYLLEQALDPNEEFSYPDFEEALNQNFKPIQHKDFRFLERVGQLNDPRFAFLISLFIAMYTSKTDKSVSELEYGYGLEEFDDKNFEHPKRAIRLDKDKYSPILNDEANSLQKTLYIAVEEKYSLDEKLKFIAERLRNMILEDKSLENNEEAIIVRVLELLGLFIPIVAQVNTTEENTLEKSSYIATTLGGLLQNDLLHFPGYKFHVEKLQEHFNMDMFAGEDTLDKVKSILGDIHLTDSLQAQSQSGSLDKETIKEKTGLLNFAIKALRKKDSQYIRYFSLQLLGAITANASISKKAKRHRGADRSSNSPLRFSRQDKKVVGEIFANTPSIEEMVVLWKSFKDALDQHFRQERIQKIHDFVDKLIYEQFDAFAEKDPEQVARFLSEKTIVSEGIVRNEVTRTVLSHTFIVDYIAKGSKHRKNIIEALVNNLNTPTYKDFHQTMLLLTTFLHMDLESEFIIQLLASKLKLDDLNSKFTSNLALNLIKNGMDEKQLARLDYYLEKSKQPVKVPVENPVKVPVERETKEENPLLPTLRDKFDYVLESKTLTSLVPQLLEELMAATNLPEEEVAAKLIELLEDFKILKNLHKKYGEKVEIEDKLEGGKLAVYNLDRFKLSAKDFDRYVKKYEGFFAQIDSLRTSKEVYSIFEKRLNDLRPASDGESLISLDQVVELQHYRTLAVSSQDPEIFEYAQSMYFEAINSMEGAPEFTLIQQFAQFTDPKYQILASKMIYDYRFGGYTDISNFDDLSFFNNPGFESDYLGMGIPDPTNVQTIYSEIQIAAYTNADMIDAIPEHLKKIDLHSPFVTSLAEKLASQGLEVDNKKLILAMTVKFAWIIVLMQKQITNPQTSSNLKPLIWTATRKILKAYYTDKTEEEIKRLFPDTTLEFAIESIDQKEVFSISSQLAEGYFLVQLIGQITDPKKKLEEKTDTRNHINQILKKYLNSLENHEKKNIVKVSLLQAHRAIIYNRLLRDSLKRASVVTDVSLEESDKDLLYKLFSNFEDIEPLFYAYSQILSSKSITNIPALAKAEEEIIFRILDKRVKEHPEELASIFTRKLNLSGKNTSKWVITEQLFSRYLESSTINPEFLIKALTANLENIGFRTFSSTIYLLSNLLQKPKYSKITLNILLDNFFTPENLGKEKTTWALLYILQNLGEAQSRNILRAIVQQEGFTPEHKKYLALLSPEYLRFIENELKQPELSEEDKNTIELLKEIADEDLPERNFKQLMTEIETQKSIQMSSDGHRIVLRNKVDSKLTEILKEAFVTKDAIILTDKNGGQIELKSDNKGRIIINNKIKIFNIEKYGISPKLFSELSYIYLKSLEVIYVKKDRSPVKPVRTIPVEEREATPAGPIPTITTTQSRKDLNQVSIDLTDKDHAEEEEKNRECKEKQVENRNLVWKYFASINKGEMHDLSSEEAFELSKVTMFKKDTMRINGKETKKEEYIKVDPIDIYYAISLGTENPDNIFLRRGRAHVKAVPYRVTERSSGLYTVTQGEMSKAATERADTCFLQEGSEFNFEPATGYLEIRLNASEELEYLRQRVSNRHVMVDFIQEQIRILIEEDLERQGLSIDDFKEFNNSKEAFKDENQDILNEFLSEDIQEKINDLIIMQLGIIKRGANKNGTIKVHIPNFEYNKTFNSGKFMTLTDFINKEKKAL